MTIVHYLGMVIYGYVIIIYSDMVHFSTVMD